MSETTCEIVVTVAKTIQEKQFEPLTVTMQQKRICRIADADDIMDDLYDDLQEKLDATIRIRLKNNKSKK